MNIPGYQVEELSFTADGAFKIIRITRGNYWVDIPIASDVLADWEVAKKILVDEYERVRGEEEKRLTSAARL